MPALFAAALDPAIDEVYLAGSPLSFADVLRVEEFGTAFADFVPKLLLHTDLPEIAAAMAPRRVWDEAALGGR